MATIVDTAIAYAGSGISVIPVLPDGSKKPAVSWKQYQRRIASEREIRAMFRPGHGIAIIGGTVSGAGTSGGLEILDFDDASIIAAWRDAVAAIDRDLLRKLVAVRTPSGGLHLYYRHEDTEEGNQKLAMRLVADEDGEKPETSAETRAGGGYAITVGSPARCHPANTSYELLAGTLTVLPILTPFERALLLDTARSLSTYTPPTPPPIPVHKAQDAEGGRPGDQYNAGADWANILEPHGWHVAYTHGVTTHWVRPGKAHEPGATTNHGGHNSLYVFTTNAYPFEAGKGYTAFTAHALLNHNGDFKAAARDLALQGYGETRPPEVSGQTAPGRHNTRTPSALEDAITGYGIALAYDKARSALRGVCPFCGSVGELWVNPRKGRWGCDGCRANGDHQAFMTMIHARGERAS